MRIDQCQSYGIMCEFSDSGGGSVFSIVNSIIFLLTSHFEFPRTLHWGPYYSLYMLMVSFEVRLFII